MLDIVIKNIPVLGQSYGFTKTAMRVYNCTDPINATQVAVNSIMDDCLPPQIKYPIKCSVLAAQIAVVCLSGGNPFSTAVMFAAARQIIDS